MRQRILRDIVKTAEKRRIENASFINLRESRKSFNLPFKNIIAASLPILVISSFILGSATAPTFNGVQSAGATTAEREVLEAQLAEVEEEMKAAQAKVDEYGKQGKTLSLEVQRLEAQIAKLKTQIKAITLNLSKLDQEIGDTQSQIRETQNDIETNKQNLANLLQTLYETGNRSMVEVILDNPDVSEFFTDVSNLMMVQDSVRMALGKIVESREKLIEQKELLAMERSDVQELMDYQNQQRANIQKTQNETSQLLTATKNRESEYQKILEEKKKTAAEIRKQIFQLLGGGELDFEKAYELAKYAEKATGVRAALILAVLDRESAMGKNVGQCDYRTAMHPKRDIPVFLQIIEDLGLTKNLEAGIIKVSCPNADGVYGGAMGPAQFIPSTWKGYTAKISSITGNKPANPWDNRDAFVATALYLKDAGAATNERIAAAKYYCGGNWNRYVCTDVYGKKVVEQAKKFQDDIDILNG